MDDPDMGDPAPEPEPDDDVLALAAQVFDMARAGATQILAAHVDAGVPVNLTNGSGDTLLILAAYHDHPGTVAALLERGADTERVNERGQTALGAAVFRRSEAGVTTLLRGGADPVAGSPCALEVARFFDLPEMLRLLGGDPRA
jgi:ankyrin repeat protein